MAQTVIVVRHALPEIQPRQPASRWPLSQAGRASAAALGQQFPRPALLASSAEVKAVQTVCLAAAVERSAIHIDDRFGEVHRPGEPFDDHHRDRRLAWISGRTDGRHEGWETPDQAADRFQHGLDQLDADVIVVGSHGMIITAWLVAIGRVRRGEPAGDFWSRLGFPAVVTVDA